MANNKSRKETAFIGEYQYNLDEKARLTLPVKFRQINRKRMPDTYVLTRGFDRCIACYPEEEWKLFVETLKDLPHFAGNSRIIRRTIITGATHCVLDKQGRITIPKFLKEYAGIDKQVVVSGDIEKLEIWSKKAWSDYIRGAENTFHDISYELEERELPKGGKTI